mmetsp:Transcript_29871/g.76628  ORF Transcript_29871/g.76628 Transcript_29871/m.76628 type:complete len:508 (-) Transcript_29871:512-2035(-)
MVTRRRRGTAKLSWVLSTGLVGLLFILYQEYKYLNLVTSNEQQTEGDGQPQSANMIIPHLLQERSDARDSRKARTPEGRRDQKSSHVRGQRSRQERLSLQPKQPGHMDSQNEVLAEGTRAGRDQTALDATSGGLQDTIGDLPQIQGDARADGSGSVGAAAATGGDHEGASDDYEDEGEGGDDAGIRGAVSVKPSAGKRVTGEDFQQVAELHLSDILKGLQFNATWERLVLNQRHMELPEKALRRAHVATEDSLRELVPEEDLTTRYPRCAIVGNSGIMLQQHAGLLIDKYNAVMRYNNAPTRDFEQYVGSRTTFRAINNKWTRSFTRALAKEGKHAAMKLIPPDSKRATSLLCFGKGVLKTFVTLRRSLPKDRRVYYITDQECCSYTLQARMERHGFGPYSGGHTMPSGFEGLFFMLQICDELDVYGFDPQIDEDVKYHYFDNIKPWENVHSFGFSFDFLRILHQAGHIRLCAPRYITDSGCPHEGTKVNEFASLWGQDRKRRRTRL